MKHPSLRVADVLDLSSSVKSALTSVFTQIENILPMAPADFELAGSYAMGHAKIHSDFDLNIAMHDWDEEIALRRLWYDEGVGAQVENLLAPLAAQWQADLEIVPCCPDNKSYNAVYSFKNDQLYNRPGNAPILKSLKWHPYRFRWEQIPIVPKIGKWDSDPFASEVDTWRTTYGNKFQEYRTVTTTNERGEPLVYLTDADN